LRIGGGISQIQRRAPFSGQRDDHPAGDEGGQGVEEQGLLKPGGADRAKSKTGFQFVGRPGRQGDGDRQGKEREHPKAERPAEQHDERPVPEVEGIGRHADRQQGGVTQSAAEATVTAEARHQSGRGHHKDGLEDKG